MISSLQRSTIEYEDTKDIHLYQNQCNQIIFSQYFNMIR